jgi:hypothetical protein
MRLAATARPRRRLLWATALVAAIPAAGVSARGYGGRRCTPPSGYRIADCRVAEHGTPDLSRADWRARHGEQVTITSPVDGLAPNPAAGGAPIWPLVDSRSASRSAGSRPAREAA